MSGYVITELFAFVAVDPSDGDEGILGFSNDAGWVPMVGADMKRVESLIPVARQIAKATGITYTIKRFKLTE